MSIRLLIFDLDGTLVDTIRDITNALNYGLKTASIRELSVEETKALVGEGISKLIEKVLGEEKKQLGEEVKNRFLEYYGDHLVDYSSVYPSVKEILGHLQNYRKAVISNKREHLSRGILHELELIRYFDLIVGSDTVSQKKPSAVPILYVLQKLGISPEQAVMVGDSNIDIEAGNNAGIATVAVTYGYRERQSLVHADYLIDSFDALPAVLDRISSKLI